MKVSEAGEFGLIELLTREFGLPFPPGREQATRPGLLVDLGDDAVVTAPGAQALIWTTDTMVEGVHFLPGVTGWTSVGWKALASNVSDIAAMGGMPDLALVTLCLPADFCVEDAVEVYRGLKECCDAYGVRLGGGDIVRAPAFAVTVALRGVAAQSPDGSVRLLRRGAARPGDAVAVSGTLGDAAGGLRLLQAGVGREEASHKALIEAHERPRPRTDLGARAALTGIECGMDISDGLLQDAGHIARASGVHLRLETGMIPLSPDLRQDFGAEALDLALTGGEDYALLLCGPRVIMERLIVEGAGLTVIGQVAAGQARVSVVDGDGAERDYSARGWDHFPGEPRR